MFIYHVRDCLFFFASEIPHKSNTHSPLRLLEQTHAALLAELVMRLLLIEPTNYDKGVTNRHPPPSSPALLLTSTNSDSSTLLEEAVVLLNERASIPDDPEGECVYE